jgi:hypothetical protein
MAETKTEKLDLFEPGTHVFTGTVKVWRGDYGELLTDSGVTVPLTTQGHPTLLEGARVTLVTRKFRPLFQVEKVTKPE